MSTKQKFEKYLTHIEYPKIFEGWHVKGMLKNNSNNIYKFDTSNLIKEDEHHYQRTDNFKNKADKMVFDFETQWIKLDINELHSYIKNNQLKEVNLDQLINNLEWNIVVNK